MLFHCLLVLPLSDSQQVVINGPIAPDRKLRCSTKGPRERGLKIDVYGVTEPPLLPIVCVHEQTVSGPVSMYAEPPTTTE